MSALSTKLTPQKWALLFGTSILVLCLGILGIGIWLVRVDSLKLTGEYSDKVGTLKNGEKSLDVLVGVESGHAGKFTVYRQLMSGDTIIITGATDVALVAGHNFMTIQFWGQDLRRSRLDGPYQVKILMITDWGRGIYNQGFRDFKYDTWQTAAYQWRDFGGDLCFALSAKVLPDSSVANLEISPAPNCPDGKYLVATPVILKVTAKPGFRFKGWSGDVGGGAENNAASPVITLRMQRDMVANAFFGPEP